MKNPSDTGSTAGSGIPQANDRSRSRDNIVRRYTEKSFENLKSLRESFLPLEEHNVSDAKPKNSPSEF